MTIDWLKRILQRIFGPFLRRHWRIPTVQVIQVSFNPVNVGKAEHDQCWLKLGTNAHGQQGMLLTVAVQAQANGGGSLEFVQLVKPYRFRSRVSTGNNEIFTSDGEWVLDGNDPYVPATPVAAGALVAPDMPDTPGSACAVYVVNTGIMTEPLELTRADDRFRTFIMWRPNHMGGNRRIPIAHVRWQWGGEAVMTQPQDKDCEDDHPNGNTYYWHLTSPSNQHAWAKRDPDYFSVPRWTRTRRDLTWRQI